MDRLEGKSDHILANFFSLLDLTVTSMPKNLMFSILSLSSAETKHESVKA